MGYASEKEQVKKKKTGIKKKLIWLSAVLVLVLVLCTAFSTADSWVYRVGTPNTGTRNEGEMRIHFIDVGQGDATLVELPDGKNMLIDGGNGTSSSNTALLRYFHALDIDTIDYLFLTHADIDHYGGLTTVLEKKTVLRAFLPLSMETPSTSYEKFFATLMQEECPYFYACPPNNEHPEMKLSVTDGAYPYTLVVLYPYIQTVDSGEKVQSDDNASSVVIWLDYQGTSVLLTGDSPSETETLLMRDSRLSLHERYGVDITSTEILKTAHHGSHLSSSAEFLEYIDVKTAVISCGENNAYHHPSSETLARLQTVGAQTYRTDTDGSVIITALSTGSYSVQTLGK